MSLLLTILACYAPAIMATSLTTQVRARHVSEANALAEAWQEHIRVRKLALRPLIPPAREPVMRDE